MHLAGAMVTRLLQLELATLTVVAGVAFFAPALFARPFRKLERVLALLARRPGLAVLIIGVVALAARLAAVPLLPERAPGVHDEFSYLLLGETFASGRLANPPSPFWQHFETFHVLQHPAYASMYPVIQGLILACGKVLFGSPLAGVWLAVAILCAAIGWALQGWMPPRWALLGGLLAALRYAVASYWATTFWGGAHAAIGGALVLGALPRLMRRARIRDSLLMGVGVVILANSRPYEGFVFALAIGFALLAWMAARSTAQMALLRPLLGRLASFRNSGKRFRIIVPAALLLIAAGGAMGYYFWRVTGNPLVMPVQASRAAYGAAPFFLWQPTRPAPHYNHAVLAEFYQQWEMATLGKMKTPAGYLSELSKKLRGIWSFYLGAAFSAPLLMLPWILRDRRVRLLIWLAPVMLLAVALEVWTFPHYVAPWTTVFVGLVVQGMRHLRAGARARPGHRTAGAGLLVSRAIPLIIAAVLLVRLVAQAGGRTSEYSWCCAGPGNQERAAVARLLNRQPGRQLVFVRYGPGHSIHDEWVYNGPDLEHERVLWAREVSPGEDAQLAAHDPARRVWLVLADEHPARLLPAARAGKSALP